MSLDVARSADPEAPYVPASRSQLGAVKEEPPAPAWSAAEEASWVLLAGPLAKLGKLAISVFSERFFNRLRPKKKKALADIVGKQDTESMQYIYLTTS